MSDIDRATFAQAMDRLIDGWCESRNLRALRLVLPVYPFASGLTDDWANLHTALKQVRISCRDALKPKEMDSIVALIHEVERALER